MKLPALSLSWLWNLEFIKADPCTVAAPKLITCETITLMKDVFAPKTTGTSGHEELISIELTYGNHLKTMRKRFTAKG